MVAGLLLTVQSITAFYFSPPVDMGIFQKDVPDYRK